MAPRPAPGQRRLDTGDDADHWTLPRRAYVSATALASYATCRTRPFLERRAAEAGLARETWAMRQGALAHQAVQETLGAPLPSTGRTFPEALATGSFLYADEVALRDERRRLRGIVDVVFADRGVLHVVELKHTRAPDTPDPVWGAAVWHGHGVQAHAYGLMARGAFGHTPRVAVTYLAGRPRDRVLGRVAGGADPADAVRALWRASVELDHGAAHRERVARLVRAFRRSERGRTLPDPGHDDPSRCRACPVRRWCPLRLDEPDRFEPFPPPGARPDAPA